jgi:hypothetical protein
MQHEPLILDVNLDGAPRKGRCGRVGPEYRGSSSTTFGSGVERLASSGGGSWRLSRYQSFLVDLASMAMGTEVEFLVCTVRALLTYRGLDAIAELR